MTVAILFCSLAAFFLIGMPIAFALGLSSVLAIVYLDVPLTMSVQKLFTANDSFPLMSIPFFILAGALMTRGGISIRLVALANAVVRGRAGGLAIVAVLGSMFFGAISGSPVSTVAAVGGILIPSMVALGYKPEFCGAVHATAGPLGGLIPPSIALIIYGVCANQSISVLFVATVLPGILMGIALMLVAATIAKRRGYGGTLEQTQSTGALLRESIWALFMPIIILGGIYSGVFTPTEAAVVAAVYALVIGIFVYRELALKDLSAIFLDTVIGTATIMIIINFSTVFSWVIAAERLPQIITESILALTDNKHLIMALITAILLIVGTFMDAAPAILIFTPVFLPLVVKLGYSPVHFGIIMCTNLLIGLSTPPVGVTLFMSSRISGVKVDKIIGEAWPFIAAMISVLILIIIFPQISLWLPKFM
ncbi:TRAP transporter large permease [Desulfovibrio sp. OttesenSCG-928-O18]|nr:TRAP transporter large permease [Desulfovibrio sp. OttesenSCG-928-O18]